MKTAFKWILGILGLWIACRPGGLELIIGVFFCVVMPFLVVGKFFNYIEVKREEVLDEFADRLAKANARRIKEKE